jgi:hypothetical protein
MQPKKQKKKRKNNAHFFLLINHKKPKQKSMKKYELKPAQFLAMQYTGDVDPLIAAMEANVPGSADSVDFKEHDKSVTFKDASGNDAVLMPNDFIQVVPNADGSASANYVAVPAATGENAWVEVSE